jgi:hypothetical protein
MDTSLVQGKNFPQHLYAKLKRMKREERGLAGQLQRARQQCLGSEERLEETCLDLQEAKDAENELLLRVIDAKLRLQQLYEEKIDITEDMSQIRKETFSLQNDTKRLLGLLSERTRIGARTIEVAEHDAAKRAQVSEKATHEQKRLREATHMLFSNKRRVADEQIALRNMDARYDLMRATAQSAIFRGVPPGPRPEPGNTLAITNGAARPISARPRRRVSAERVTRPVRTSSAGSLPRGAPPAPTSRVQPRNPTHHRSSPEIRLELMQHPYYASSPANRLGSKSPEDHSAAPEPQGEVPRPSP